MSMYQHFTRNLHKMNKSSAGEKEKGGGGCMSPVEVNDIIIVQYSVFISAAIIVLIQRN